MITRLISGILGLALVLPLLAWGGQVAVDVLVGVVVLLSVYEYGGMAHAGDRLVGTLWTGLGAAAIYASVVLDPAWTAPLAGGLVLSSFVFVVLRPGPELSRAADRVGRHLMGMAWVGGLLSFLPLVRQLPHGVWWVVLVLALAWLGDTGGYFAGRAFGRHKLYPRVSPKKTWEGLAGGIALTTAGVYVVMALGIPELSALDCLILGVFVGGAATLGDLSESLLKRAFSVKDSGKLMPGHGGLLDRIDSVLFTAPLVWFYAVLIKGL